MAQDPRLGAYQLGSGQLAGAEAVPVTGTTGTVIATSATLTLLGLVRLGTTETSTSVSTTGVLIQAPLYSYYPVIHDVTNGEAINSEDINQFHTTQEWTTFQYNPWSYIQPFASGPIQTTLSYSGTGVSLYGNKLQQSMANAFTNEQIGTATIPCIPIGSGCDLRVSLWTDNNGLPGTELVSTIYPKEWFTMASPLGLAATAAGSAVSNSSTSSSSASANPITSTYSSTQVPWTHPALNGFIVGNWTPQSSLNTLPTNVFNNQYPGDIYSTYYETMTDKLSPSAYWKLADLTDSSGNGYTLTNNGNVGFIMSGGYPNPSRVIGNFVAPSQLGLRSTYNPVLTQFTIECFVGIDVGQIGNPRIIANSHTDVDLNGFQLAIPNSGNEITLGIGNGTATTSVTAYNPGAFFHVACTYDGTTLRMYIDGIEVDSAPFSGTVSAGTAAAIGIGYDPAYNGDYFTGNIYQVAIYTFALSAQSILAHYGAYFSQNSQITGSLAQHDAGIIAVGGSTTNGNGYTNVFLAQNQGDSLGPWTASTNVLPINAAGAGIVSFDNNVVIAGGTYEGVAVTLSTSVTEPTTPVYMATILSGTSISAWTAQSSIPGTYQAVQLTFDGTTLYAFCMNQAISVYTASYANNTLGTWQLDYVQTPYSPYGIYSYGGKYAFDFNESQFARPGINCGSLISSTGLDYDIAKIATEQYSPWFVSSPTVLPTGFSQIGSTYSTYTSAPYAVDGTFGSTLSADSLSYSPQWYAATPASAFMISGQSYGLYYWHGGGIAIDGGTFSFPSATSSGIPELGQLGYTLYNYSCVGYQTYQQYLTNLNLAYYQTVVGFYYPLDDIGPTIRDIMGGKIGATLSNVTLGALPPGGGPTISGTTYNKTAYFNGTNSTIVSNLNPGASQDTQFTSIDGWVYIPSVPGSTQMIWSCGTITLQVSSIVGSSSFVELQLSFYNTGTMSVPLVATQSVPIGEWHYIACEVLVGGGHDVALTLGCDGITSMAYVTNVVYGSTAAGQLSMGYNPVTTSEYFSGYLSNVSFNATSGTGTLPSDSYYSGPNGNSWSVARKWALASEVAESPSFRMYQASALPVFNAIAAFPAFPEIAYQQTVHIVVEGINGNATNNVVIPLMNVTQLDQVGTYTNTVVSSAMIAPSGTNSWTNTTSATVPSLPSGTSSIVPTCAGFQLGTIQAQSAYANVFQPMSLQKSYPASLSGGMYLMSDSALGYFGVGQYCHSYNQSNIMFSVSSSSASSDQSVEAAEMVVFDTPTGTMRLDATYTPGQRSTSYVQYDSTLVQPQSITSIPDIANPLSLSNLASDIYPLETLYPSETFYP